MSQLHHLLENGGHVLVVGGHVAIPDHAQISVWEGDTTELRRKLKAHNSELPSNCRGLVLSRWLEHKIIIPLISSARKRRIVVFNGLSDAKIRDLVEEIVTPNSIPIALSPSPITPSPSPDPPTKLKPLRQFVADEHRIGERNKDEARRLFLLATERGYQTTERSLVSEVSYLRVKCGLTIPATRKKPEASTEPKLVSTKSTAPHTSVAELLQLLEGAMTSLTLIADELRKMTLIPREVHDAYQQLLSVAREQR